MIALDRGHDRAAIGRRSRRNRVLLSAVRWRSQLSSEDHVGWTVLIVRSSLATIVVCSRRIQRSEKLHVATGEFSDCGLSLAHLSLVRWRSDDRSVSTRQHVSPRSHPLSLLFQHVRWWMIAWTRVHAIEGSHLDPTQPCRHVAYNIKNVWEHNPTRRKNWERVSLKDANQGPLTRGPSICQPSHATWRPSRAFADEMKPRGHRFHAVSRQK